ncbi:helix-turn-helix domain-containing protein [Paenibacillus alkalitolerans]|uniref:helix-turn-helix domain-containing protein n=1 Tax=Paenibacillus alkalitolerans TaxID=2799335 RepID=UPI0018F3E620|nr:helix-turn-helix transcriptional regulator [Paenibacillus alkalitolerans]
MDIKKFGAYISHLRKEHDLTQSHLADFLSVTRQAISRWEVGDSFPDIAMLPKLSEIFCVTVDQLLNCGEEEKDESKILRYIVDGRADQVIGLLKQEEVGAESVVNIAPLVKASTLELIAEGFEKHGVEIKHIVELAVYMNETGLTKLMKKASLDKLDEDMLEKFIPFLDEESKGIIFSKIIDGELHGSLLAVMIPYLDLLRYGPLIEAAVMEGQLDDEILKELSRR